MYCRYFLYGLFVCTTDDSSVGACSLLALVWAIMISQILKYLHRSCANHESYTDHVCQYFFITSLSNYFPLFLISSLDDTWLGCWWNMKIIFVYLCQWTLASFSSFKWSQWSFVCSLEIWINRLAGSDQGSTFAALPKTDARFSTASAQEQICDAKKTSLWAWKLLLCVVTFTNIAQFMSRSNTMNC